MQIEGVLAHAGLPVWIHHKGHKGGSLEVWGLGGLADSHIRRPAGALLNFLDLLDLLHAPGCGGLAPTAALAGG